jgi:hypothetical protein
LDTRNAEKEADQDPHAHWAVPALDRLLSLPPPSSGVVGDAHYHDIPFSWPDRQIPPPPKNMDDKEAVKRWLDHCWMLRNIFGSGN